MDHKNLNSIQSIALPIDTVLHDRYIIKKVLSKGGFSITYIAHDKTLNMSTVIKEFMPKDMLERENGTTELIVRYDDMQQDFRKGAENFLDEARILARFADCEGVVSVMDFFAENNTAYIVMPYIQGTTLSEFIPQNGGLSEQETIEMLSPVISTLSKVHKAGIIHRDISPDNILITKDKKAILLDFGICLPINDDSKEVVQEKPTSLKHGYAPPEQYCYKGIQGPWTDVYSMAATMYFCIEGKGLMSAVNRMHQQKDIILYSDINPAILKGLNLLSKNRYPDMDTFLVALTEKPRRARKNKVIKPLAAVSVVALAFIAGFILNSYISINDTFKMDPAIEDAALNTETAEPAETISAESKEYLLLDLDDDDPVPIADSNLEAAIREQLSQPDGDILFGDIAEIRQLHMNAKNIENLDGIQYFVKLTHLDVNNNLIKDLEPVVFLKNLESIGAGGNLISDISCLESCTSVSSIDLNSNYIVDVSSLENLINLTWLNLMSNQISDLTPILTLPKLQWLSVSGNNIDDYSSLAEIPRLEEVDSQYQWIIEESPDNTMPFKKEYVLLDLDDNDPVPIADANLEAAIRQEINLPKGEIHLKDISEVRTLNMLAMGINDLDGIQYFANLTWLDVGNNLISDLTPITYLNNLSLLRVHGNLIYDISPLESCVSISELDLASNYIEDISLLENLTNLTWLDLHSNKVSDATAIMHLPKLQWLNIGGNDLGDYTYLAELPRIEELSVNGDEAYAYAFVDHPTLIRFEP